MLFNLFIIFFAFSLPFCTLKHAEPTINQITLDERFYLNKYFEYLVRYEHLGHVLFLDKPMAYASFPINGIKSYPANCITKGWYIWEKHKNKFFHPNYIIISEITKNKFNSDVDVCEIFIINKLALHALLMQNDKFFRTKLGEGFQPDQFIADLECNDIKCSWILSKESTLGVMLGYGIDSSIYYEQGHRHLQDIYSSNNQIMSIAPIRFVFDPNSDEAKSLLNKHEYEITQLRTIYQNRKFFETSIKQLCADL